VLRGVTGEQLDTSDAVATELEQQDVEEGSATYLERGSCVLRGQRAEPGSEAAA